MTNPNAVFTATHERLLLDLVQLRTVTPLEVDTPGDVLEAQRRYAQAAAHVGMEIVYHAPAAPSVLEGAHVPQPVRDAAARQGPAFLTAQPNLVLRLGPPRLPSRTLAFNFHIDTVDGGPAPALVDGQVRGRGAVDAKGPGVAVLAGIEAAVSWRPSLADDISVLVQCVSGEEGGAMGVYGSEVVADAGFLGRLNVFAEPTDGWFFDHATASMTARIAVNGDDAIDDAPDEGHNATVVLGVAASALAAELDPAIRKIGGRTCIAGLHTGAMHNRVYGSGELLVNFAYGTAPTGARIEQLVQAWLLGTRRSFASRFACFPATARAARDIDRILTVTWLKRGLPPLANRDPAIEAVLRRAGLRRLPDDVMAARAFTCDAIWGQRRGAYTIVCGPGDLARNGAHTERESVSITELDCYARRIAALLLEFADTAASGTLERSESAA